MHCFYLWWLTQIRRLAQKVSSVILVILASHNRKSSRLHRFSCYQDHVEIFGVRNKQLKGIVWPSTWWYLRPLSRRSWHFGMRLMSLVRKVYFYISWLIPSILRVASRNYKYYLVFDLASTILDNIVICLIEIDVSLIVIYSVLTALPWATPMSSNTTSLDWITSEPNRILEPSSSYCMYCVFYIANSLFSL